MPGSLIQPSGRETNEISNEAGYQVWRASKSQGNSSVEPERSDDRREEIVERASREMHILDKAEEIEPRIPNCLLEPFFRSLVWGQSDGVAVDSFDSHGSLLFSEPFCVAGMVGEEDHRKGCHGESDDSFDDEDPSPSLDPLGSIYGIEDSCCDETSECGSENVPRV